MVLPFAHHIKQEQLMLETGSGEVRGFPAPRAAVKTAKRKVRKKVVPKRSVAKKPTTTKTSKYDESYLDQLLKEDEQTKDEPVQVEKEYRKKSNFFDEKPVQDNVEMKQAAPDRNEGEFGMIGYAGKFAGFLILVIALFYGLVNLMKRGTLKRKIGLP